MSVRRSALAPPAVADQTASSVVIRISRTASAMQNGMLDVNEEPGLQSVARATVAPASSSRRACGNGCLQLNSTPGSRVATTGVDTSASTSSSVRNVQWSADAAPASAATRTPGPGPSWLACTRALSPAARPAASTAAASSAPNAPSSQNTSTQRADGAQASSIGPHTRST